MEFSVEYFPLRDSFGLVHNKTVTGCLHNKFFKTTIAGTCFNGFRIINNIVRKNNGIVSKSNTFNVYYFDSMEDATTTAEKLNALQLANLLIK